MSTMQLLFDNTLACNLHRKDEVSIALPKEYDLLEANKFTGGEANISIIEYVSTGRADSADQVCSYPAKSVGGFPLTSNPFSDSSDACDEQTKSTQCVKDITHPMNEFAPVQTNTERISEISDACDEQEQVAKPKNDEVSHHVHRFTKKAAHRVLNKAVTEDTVLKLVRNIRITHHFSAKNRRSRHYPFAKSVKVEYVTRTEDGQYFYDSIMPFYADGTLFDVMRSLGGSNPKEDSLEMILAIVIQLLGGIEHLNRHGVAHCDLSVSNILMKWVDGMPFAKIFDFGYATTSGTTAFNPPEVLYAYANVDPRKMDAYSIGIISMLLTIASHHPDACTQINNFFYHPSTGEPYDHKSQAQVSQNFTAVLLVWLKEIITTTTNADGKHLYTVLLRLCTGLLMADSEERWSAEDALTFLLGANLPETLLDTLTNVLNATEDHTLTNGDFEVCEVNSTQEAKEYIKKNVPLATFEK